MIPVSEGPATKNEWAIGVASEAAGDTPFRLGSHPKKASTNSPLNATEDTLRSFAMVLSV